METLLKPPGLHGFKYAGRNPATVLTSVAAQESPVGTRLVFSSVFLLILRFMYPQLYLKCICSSFAHVAKQGCQSRDAIVSISLFVTSWASKDVVWNNMLEKDKTYTRDVHMMENHPHLQPKMRAILLDWLMEVCKIS